MIWALLAAYLTKRPPAIQAFVVGLCTGLFVAAMADANNRDPRIGTTVILVIAVAVAAGGLFLLGLRSQQVAAGAEADLPTWVVAVYVGVWALSILAAVRALFGAGGFKVAVLAIIPIVLLGPTAMGGLRRLSGHPRKAA